MEKDIIQKNIEEEIVKTVVKNVVERIIKEKNVISQFSNISEKYKIPLGVSVRHIHITEEHYKILFGETAKLEVLRYLRQPGEFASKSTCTIVGPNMIAIENVRILGPHRKFTQVELAKTDAITIGIKNLPLRNSGDVANSAPITIVGPKGSIYLKEGAIRAWRHIHLDLEAAAYYNLKDKDIVKVRVPGETSVIFENVIVRVSQNYLPEFHIDTDEANAVGLKENTEIELIK
ncbi:MAG TPA: phosphate propanoyltransferase [bacterium]|nr:phosphate propanoyltransferase [bacterium]HOL48795.1 phosphate propanoyltransferase [bacterium]HPQ19594.1 phosphate propanoyltransferase [bacterium]